MSTRVAEPEADGAFRMARAVRVDGAHRAELPHQRQVTRTLEDLEGLGVIHRTWHAERMALQARNVRRRAMREIVVALLQRFRQVGNLASGNEADPWRRIR